MHCKLALQSNFCSTLFPSYLYFYKTEFFDPNVYKIAIGFSIDCLKKDTANISLFGQYFTCKAAVMELHCIIAM